jgi:hypothetical protein
MHRSFQIIALTSVLVVGSTGAHALDAGKVDAVTKAADAFAALAKDSHNTGQPPRQSDAVAKPLLDIVLDTTEATRSRVPWNQLLTLNGWNLAVIKVGLVYMLAGTGASDLAALNDKPDAAAKVDRNTVAFAPELGRYFDAQLRLQGAIMDTVQEFLRTAQRAQLENPQFKSGVGQIRSGVAQTITGMFGTFTLEGTTDDWRRARLVVANAIAPKAAKFLPPEEAGSVRAAALEIAGQMSDAKVKDGLTRFAKTLGARP